VEGKTCTLHKLFMHHSAFDLIVYHLTVSLLAKLFELYLEFLEKYHIFVCCAFLTELSNSPLFPKIFLDDTVRQSHFFVMA
jgi:hypothetical protein